MLFSKQIIQKVILISVIPALFACGSATDGAGSAAEVTVDGVENAAAVAGNLFGNNESQLSVSRALLERFVEQAEDQVEENANDTCTPYYEESEDQGPNGVDTWAYGEAGSYGSSAEAVELIEDDFCSLADGTPNSGTGPDGDGLFASFEIIEDVLFDCTNEQAQTIVMQAGSAGVFRNTAEYLPQIYGTFNYLIDGEEEITLECTIFLNDQEEIVSANCSSEGGDVVVQESDTSCVLSE